MAALRGALEAKLANRPAHTVSVLEAGGGSASVLQKDGYDFSFTTIDISPEQLARNHYASTKILGDIETYDYERSYDVIVVWDVLEHLRAPGRALARLAGALGPGGLIILKGPIPNSMKGLVTRATPHWAHVLFYRKVMRKPQAGQPGHAPFKTEHQPEADPAVLRAALAGAGLDLVLDLAYPSDHLERLAARSRPLHAAFVSLARLVERATGGRYGGLASEFVLIARKGAPG